MGKIFIAMTTGFRFTPTGVKERGKGKSRKNTSNFRVGSSHLLGAVRIQGVLLAGAGELQPQLSMLWRVALPIGSHF